jgi:hypothetical protein
MGVALEPLRKARESEEVQSLGLSPTEGSRQWAALGLEPPGFRPCWQDELHGATRENLRVAQEAVASHCNAEDLALVVP